MHAPIPGQVMMINDTAFYSEKAGDIFKWNDRNDPHSAANASLEPYYLFHYEGYYE
jgi:hypothetical protein